MLWGYEDKPPVITDPQIQATDIARIRTAVERRMGVSRAPPGVTPASGGSGGFTRTPARMQCGSCRTSTNFTTQLVNQFTKEIEQGIKPGDLRSHLGAVEYRSRMKKAWDRAVVETAGPWWVYRGSYANFEEAFTAGALKAVLAQKINNNNRKKKRADNKEDKATPKAARTDEPLQPQQTNTNEPPTQPPGPTEQPAADSHASSLASADASQGFLLCGSLQNKENMEVIAVAMPMSTLLPQLRPTDRVSMTILRPLAKLGVSTLISVGGVTFNYTKNASSVPWPVAGIYSCFEGKTAASYGFTKEQIEKAMMQ
ncbi:hypothetical protein HXX76_014922 [Chlamydomonas incerta]|uniref:Uncharacterized protein n=1 Tax=Chlamydomonas incerta TaxID=51695 RepID=A0A835SB05_CHLIN|nr:hypothetical protein HXX76_014922 [Chlamydomonas incerta]|eukprot:KAG2423983.1 hypothetical protein HXX76_014922 [Chlamydomonas incerta]